MSIFGAFEGVRVLDLTNNLAGPFGTQILADLGADVIKVERPVVGDDTRNFHPKADGESVVFASVNRNKRSIVLDLKDPADRQVAVRLGATCDVIVESFRPGTADKLGLGYEDFRALDRSVVYCSVSAFGRGEAGKELPGYDPLIQAFCGVMSTTGHPGNPPTRVAASLIDLSTGMWAAIGISAALADRHRTGHGQHVEATLVDSGYTLMCHQLSGYRATGELPGQLGSGSPITAPYEAFRAADGWVMIAAGNNDLFGRLCRSLGLGELADDDRFRGAHDRVRNREELHALLEATVSRMPAQEAIATIRGAGVPIGPVNEIDQAVEEPIVEERELLIVPQESDNPDLRVVRLPLTSGGAPARRTRRAPALGEDGDALLAELEDIELSRTADQALDVHAP
jgi:crotonobetainyl-CoA:carnitine CoA-transferase CaiB-like acyl-CoA transferase